MGGDADGGGGGGRSERNVKGNQKADA